MQAELRINPNHAEAHYEIADILQLRGQRDAAMQHLVEAVRIEPRMTEAHLAIERIYFAEGRFDEADRSPEDCCGFGSVQSHTSLPVVDHLSQARAGGGIASRPGRIPAAAERLTGAGRLIELPPGWDCAWRDRLIPWRRERFVIRLIVDRRIARPSR